MKKLFTLVGAMLLSTSMFAQSPEGWESIIKNGNLSGDDFSSFYIKEQGVNPNDDGGYDPAPVNELVAMDGAQSEFLEGEGPEGQNVIKVYAPTMVSKAWDTQFWIVFDKPIEADSKIYVRFKYKADKEYGMIHQAHSQSPGDYHHWDGGFGSYTFTDEWQEAEGTVTVSSDQAGSNGYGSIAFNLTPRGADDSTPNDMGDNTYYFCDFEVTTKTIVVAEFDPLNTFLNGSFELGIEESKNPDETINFTIREFGQDDRQEITEGVGVEGTNCVVIQSSTADDGVTEDHHTQFFITSNHKFAAGERFQVTFDYRACAVDGENPAGGYQIDTQCHGATPGSYIMWHCIGSPVATTEWQTYDSNVVKVADDMTNTDNPFQTIAFNLNKNKDKAAKFYFDNIKWYLDDGDDGYTVEEDTDLNEKVEDQFATGVKELKTKKATKAVFNLAGQQVDSNYKGIVIENGQKRINK